jgi:hypothetical protein
MPGDWMKWVTVLSGQSLVVKAKSPDPAFDYETIR